MNNDLFIAVRELYIELMPCGRGSPLLFFDTDSKENLQQKYNVLLKIKNDEDMSNEEYYDKKVFELLPDNINPDHFIIN